MDLCKYAYYSDRKEYFPILYCKLKGENGRCIYSKKCLKVEKFIPLENEMWRECAEYIMEKRKNIPVGSYFIQTTRPNKHGNLFLYVLIEDNKIEKILSNFTNIDQDYIYLKNKNGKYEISLKPFEEEKENDNITIYVNEELSTEKKRGRKRQKKDNISTEKTEKDNE